MSDTRAFLLAHAAAYPALTLTDLFKALYQSAFGCEHLVADPSAFIRLNPFSSSDNAFTLARPSSKSSVISYSAGYQYLFWKLL